VRTFAHSALGISLAGALLAGCGTSQLPSATSPSGAARFAFTHHITFRYTGKKQTFKVPRGVTRIRVIAVGANGGGRVIAHGGRVSAVIPVTPSETIAIYVGGAGSSSRGGFNGGAGGQTAYGDNSGYGGGGASDVREGGDALKNRVVVTGGGGGQGFAPFQVGKRYGGRGGQGGARTGGSGKAGCCDKHLGNGGGGTGGTQQRGGSGGEGSGQSGQTGQLGYGGVGGSGCPTSCGGYLGGGGGGGGGGYYGGGGGGGGIFYGSAGEGGGGGGGGGGGSSFAEGSATHVQMTSGVHEGDGMILIAW
jgi:hypothetical protein